MATQIGTVVLPNPRSGDKVEAEPNRTFNRRRSGQHVSVHNGRPFNWTYTWVYLLRRTKADELVTFLKANVGDLITIDDYLGNTLNNCIILNPDATINEIRDHYTDTDCDQIEVTVRFIYVNP